LTIARGSRTGQRPASTACRKSATCWLKAAGSSRLMVWPLFGITTRPAVGIVRFISSASLEQSYDVGHTGRFGRHVLGFLMALDHPFGIGPLQFRTVFPEDPHNAYLNAFSSGGWLSGFTYLALTASSLVMGVRTAFLTTPWRPAFLAVYAAFVGVAIESFIIDTDHWRHHFLLVGVLWGLMAASRAYVARRRSGQQYAAGLSRPAAHLAHQGMAASR
jgi:hypothetical protein